MSESVCKVKVGTVHLRTIQKHQPYQAQVELRVRARSSLSMLAP